ncbi:hypothetical protein [Bacillus mycoides]|uniref:hypothetical protein n=1 Tax=Bacillus mycoides TaxID=1405 RepID=UPI001C022B7F|nr:hypothetical protein [Bacillus mycoides]QWI47153.1 hypothetical protein EXW55_30275 [Bacillus mycoides]
MIWLIGAIGVLTAITILGVFITAFRIFIGSKKSPQLIKTFFTQITAYIILSAIQTTLIFTTEYNIISEYLKLTSNMQYAIFFTSVFMIILRVIYNKITTGYNKKSGNQ